MAWIVIVPACCARWRVFLLLWQVVHDGVRIHLGKMPMPVDERLAKIRSRRDADKEYISNKKQAALTKFKRTHSAVHSFKNGRPSHGAAKDDDTDVASRLHALDRGQVVQSWATRSSSK